jgi:hypothetical protein
VANDNTGVIGNVIPTCRCLLATPLLILTECGTERKHLHHFAVGPYTIKPPFPNPVPPRMHTRGNI